MPNDTGPTPEVDDPNKYKKLAAVLHKEIRHGAHEPGTPVPTITELSRDLGWSRQICSKAPQLLVNEDFLVRYVGLGYYVSQRSP